MRSIGNHNDSTNATCYFGAVDHPQEMAYQDGERNTEAEYPRTGLKYVTEGGPTSSPHDRRKQALQSEFPGPGRLKIGDDDRNDGCLDRILESAEPSQGDRRSGCHRRQEGHLNSAR